jgi:hypothetical protein
LVVGKERRSLLSGSRTHHRKSSAFVIQERSAAYEPAQRVKLSDIGAMRAEVLFSDRTARNTLRSCSIDNA